MKRFYPSISKPNQSTNVNPQNEEISQAEEATENESTPQNTGPSSSSVSSEASDNLLYRVANANTGSLSSPSSSQDLHHHLSQVKQVIIFCIVLPMLIQDIYHHLHHHLSQGIRDNGWDELMKETNDFCIKYNILVPNMDDTIPARGRSRGRGCTMVTYYHRFRYEIFNVVHDQVLVELNNRFAEKSTQLLRCIACLDPNNSFANFDEDKLVELAEMYADNFSMYEISFVLRNQLETFIVDVRGDSDFVSCHDLGNLAVKMVQTDRHLVFPLVYRLIELALILPVATASVERAFSAMNIIKTELRNKMGDDWMNYSMIFYIERDVFHSISDDDIVYRFQAYCSRRGVLPLRFGTGSSTTDEVMGGSYEPIQ